MKWLLNFFRGTVTLVVTGVQLEYFLNCCAKEGLRFWAVDIREPFVLSMKVPLRDLGGIKEVGARCGCDIEQAHNQGFPFLAFRFRKRYALLAGLLLCVAAVVVGSRFIFVIDIQGNENLTAAELLSTMRQFGVKPGVYGPSIDSRELSNQMILAMDELIFFSINLHGTRAEVIVKEATPKPELVDDKEATNVIATASGIITHMEVYSGRALVQEGDTVQAGQVLITGYIDVEEAEYANADLGSYFVRAEGKIEAMTVQTITAKIPIKTTVKDYTGDEHTRYSMNLFGDRVNFYGNGGISFDKYDKITENKTWVLSDGNFFPVGLEKETFREYTPIEAKLDEEAAADMVKEELLKTLQSRIGDEGEISRCDFVTNVSDGFLEVTLLAECSQQIGKVVPLEGSYVPQEIQAQEDAQKEESQ